jgi:glycosyltransferase involved in cell wall biosynthesis
LGIAVEIATLVGVRTIFAAGFDTDVQPRHALFRRSRWWPLYAWGLARTDRIFVQHTGQLSELGARWRPKAYIVPSIAGELPLVKAHSERSPYVAWVAMLRQAKRPDVLIEIARKMPAVRFVVCGGPTPYGSPPGYSGRIIEALRAQPNIEFLGKVTPAKTRQILAGAAMLLSTSDAEGFPNTFLEAWSNGTPVISLKIDPDHIIERQKLGTISGNVERAVADINALLNVPQERDQIGERGRQYVAHAHSEAVVAATVERAIGHAR